MPLPPRRRRSWLRWLLVALFLSPAVWALVHVVRGGTELPPPMWTEADLIPLPEPSENAWESIGAWKTLPRLGRELALDLERGDFWAVATSPGVAAELARPEVVALLAQVPDALARTRFADPHAWDLKTRDPIRLPIWHRWVVLSAAANMSEEPEATARTIASLFALSTDCANAARTTYDYQICARLVERSIELMLDVADSFEGKGTGEVTRALSEALRATPPLSSKNALMGQYVWVHGQITSTLQDHKWSAPLMTDLWSTFAELDESFLLDTTEDRCAVLGALRKRSSFGQLFGYNALGNMLLRDFGTFDCVHLPYVQDIENAVAEQRKALSKRVEPR